MATVPLIIPSNADLALDALSRIGIRGSAITADHMLDLRLSAVVILEDWSGNRSVNLWAVDLQSIPLVQGVATYFPPPDTISLLDVYINDGFSDLLIGPISRDEYAAQPNKGDQGRPTVYWFNRQLVPEITLWQVPDSGSYTLNFYRMRTLANWQALYNATPDMPGRFLRAFTSELAFDMAQKYPPDPKKGIAIADLERWAQMHWMNASGQDIENAAVHLEPNFSPYFR